MRNSGLVQVDELTAAASWETGDCLVVRFDPNLMSKDQLELWKRMRSKTDHVTVALPAGQKERAQIVGFDQQNHSVYLALVVPA